MDMGDARGLITLATMMCFLGICWWAYHSGNRSRFEEDAMLPFADEPGERLDVAMKAGNGTSEGEVGR